MVNRVQLNFNTDEEQRRSFDAVNWLVDRFGHATSINNLNIPLHELTSWRSMSDQTFNIIMDNMKQYGRWWHCSDMMLYLRAEEYSEYNHYQQFFFTDPRDAIMFKLMWA